MTAASGNRFHSWIGIVGMLVLVTATPSARGQGYGADPFQPYTSQYNPYTYPTGPASPDAGQSGVRLGRSAIGRANQFQDYLDDFSGDRNTSDRSGFGTPYFRSSVAPEFDAARRNFRPTQKADLSFEASQRLITQKYVAYLSERDPKKRAELLREVRRSQRNTSRSLNGRQDSPSQLLDAANRRQSAGADESVAPRSRMTPSRTGSARSADRSSTIGPPPPITGTRRPARSADPAPSDVLERARKLERDTDDSTDLPANSAPRANPRRRPAPPPVSQP